MVRLEVRAQGIVLVGERILLARHVKKGGRYWVLPGGHREPRETLEEALARELVEEAAIRATGATLFSVSEVVLPGREILDVVFRIVSFEGEPRLGDASADLADRSLEGLELRHLSEIPELDFRPAALGARIHSAWRTNDWSAVGYLGDLARREA